MTSVPNLGRLIGLKSLEQYADPATWWTKQSEITRRIAEHLSANSTAHWLNILDSADVWCAPVLQLPELVAHEGFKKLEMAQTMSRISRDGKEEIQIETTRSPIRIDGKALRVSSGAPTVGQHSEQIKQEFL
jgi:CoA:oxalate CoA-transferase